MTRQERRRAILDLGKWELEREDLSTADKPLFKWSPRYVEPDPRLEKASENPARAIKYIRCRRDGRMVGALMKTSEGSLLIAYVVDDVDKELRAVPVFLDDLSGDVSLKCRRHEPRIKSASEIRTWANRRDLDDLII